MGLPEAGELSRHRRWLSNESGMIVPLQAVMRALNRLGSAEKCWRLFLDMVGIYYERDVKT